jgi:hypothetical protein
MLVVNDVSDRRREIRNWDVFWGRHLGIIGNMQKWQYSEILAVSTLSLLIPPLFALDRHKLTKWMKVDNKLHARHIPLRQRIHAYILYFIH